MTQCLFSEPLWCAAQAVQSAGASVTGCESGGRQASAGGKVDPAPPRNHARKVWHPLLCCFTTLSPDVQSFSCSTFVVIVNENDAVGHAANTTWSAHLGSP